MPETKRLIELLATYFGQYSGMAGMFVGKEKVAGVERHLRAAWRENFPDRQYPGK